MTTMHNGTWYHESTLFEHKLYKNETTNPEQKKKGEWDSNQGRSDWDEESYVFLLSIRLSRAQFKLHYT